jgi:DNA adenine methylase
MKYLGSKQRIINDILPIMLEKIDEKSAFVDAFCGGCSVIENVPSQYRRIANDNNKYLIAMWKSLTNDKVFCHHIEKEFYSKIRDDAYGRTNNYDDDLVGWVGFMASYNGRFVDAGYSGHNVIGTNGKSRDYISENINNTLKQIPKLKGVEWQSGNYWEMEIPENSLIYCDIPYKNTKQYSTSKNFDYEKFYEWCKEMKNKGHTIFISEYNMPDEFKCIWSKQITNAMHQTNTKKAVEKLFTI